jgi:endoglucanase
MEMKQLLERICFAPSPAGDETRAAEDVCAVCAAYAGLTFTRDTLGNFISNGDADFAIMAHIDKIGYIVTGVDRETGFLRIAALGGADARVAPAQRVSVTAADRVLPGVVVSTPPHLLPKDADSGVLPVNKLAVDCGLPPEEMLSLVKPGDRILFRPFAPTGALQLAGSRVSLPYLDNGAGAAAAVAAAKLVKDAGGKPPRIILTVQEEVGSRGAKTAAFPEELKTVIAVDTTFGSAPGVPEEESAPLGSGARIGFSPILNAALSKKLVRAAEENGIPYTVEVMGRSTGTDADSVGIAGSGRIAGLVSVPIRNMHTPAETVDLKDVEAVARLLAKTMLNAN